MKKYSLLLMTLFFLQIFAYSQQLPIFTQYREFHSFLNPAMLHTDYVSMVYKPNQTVGVSYRDQWIGLSHAPRTYAIRYEYIAEEQNSVWGGNLLKDETGPNSQVGGYVRYAYRVAYSRHTYMSFGLRLGTFKNQFVAAKSITKDPGDPEAKDENTRWTFDYAMGAFFNHEFSNNDVFYAGFSIPQTSNNFDKQIGLGSNVAFKTTHTYLVAGMYKYLGDAFLGSDGASYLEPSIWVKHTNGAPLQSDFNLRLQVPLAFVGLGYGLGFGKEVAGSFLHFELGTNITLDEDRTVKIGYGFDNLLTGSNYAGFGYTHEINLVYTWANGNY